ncbi:MAG: hypothetical protein K9J17_05580 [Flavobacteriales bacterium]|nr:hypothetical protein [Flavobacteriales bacterium]
MELNSYELKAVREYCKAIGVSREPTDALRDARDAVISLMQSICIHEFHIDKSSSDFRSPLYTVDKKEFFSSKNKQTNKYTFRSGILQKVRKNIGDITEKRNWNTYKDDFELIEREFQQLMLGLQIVMEWYLTNYRRYSLVSITNLSNSEREALQPLFKVVPERRERRYIEREEYCVILLIDSSQSMIWPFLDDQSNWDKWDSQDYKNAVARLRLAIGEAHKKALQALRGSAICKDGYLKIYQYTFDSRKHLINPPEYLEAMEGSDKVVTLGGEGYRPGGMTALYDTIDESLRVVYNELREVEESHKRIDKVSIGVITDGEDTITDGIEVSKSPEAYASKKIAKVNQIRKRLEELRSRDNKKSFLVSSVLIGLTGSEFSNDKLESIREELNFNESISIDNTDAESIRRAFQLFSTNAKNT